MPAGGEVVTLQRCDVDLSAGTVQVRQAFVEHRGTGLILGPPKSRASAQTVALPKATLPSLKQHMNSHVGEVPEAFMFTGERRRGRPGSLVGDRGAGGTSSSISPARGRSTLNSSPTARSSTINRQRGRVVGDQRLLVRCDGLCPRAVQVVAGGEDLYAQAGLAGAENLVRPGHDLLDR